MTGRWNPLARSLNLDAHHSLSDQWFIFSSIKRDKPYLPDIRVLGKMYVNILRNYECYEDRIVANISTSCVPRVRSVLVSSLTPDTGSFLNL